MRRTLGTTLLTTTLGALLPLGLLAGCGDDAGSASDPAPTSSQSSPGAPSGDSADSPGSGDEVDFDRVAMVSRTAAGGHVDDVATALDDPAAVSEFARQFRGRAMGERLRAVVRGADVPEGRTLVGAIVAVGCDRPDGVRVRRADDALMVAAVPVATPLPECLAPVTTVAVLAVPSDLAT